MSLKIQFSKLTEDEKLLMFEVAKNPAYTKIIEEELDQTQKNLLSMSQMDTESDTEFSRRHLKYSIRLNFLNELLDINEAVFNFLTNKEGNKQ